LMLDSATDYRLQNVRQSGAYHSPLDKKVDRTLIRLFERLTSEAEELEIPLVVNGRQLDIPMAADGVALVSFDDMCAKPLGAGDYLAIAGRFHTLIVREIPTMGPQNRNEAKRFVTLIDALYEHNVSLICSAEAPAMELYSTGDGSFEFERTASRLIEMQSESYLAKAHKSQFTLA
ncbi:MAG TPA: cell division protein ZapE, partial [Rhodospirillales bacterium]|nr:cell division protein ZapE [Rhodospirillales bacterium]